MYRFTEYHRHIGLVLGGGVLLFTIILPPPLADLSRSAWLALGMALLMAIWWTSDALPIAVTALVPIALAPLLSLSSVKAVAEAYGHPLIFLFLGGFMLSLAMEKCELHRRIALRTLLLAGAQPKRQILAVMAVTAFLSMWMSNTATAVMMLPIGMSIIEMQKSNRTASDPSFAVALLLAIAYSASIGGMATLIGTPPNALLAAYLDKTYNIQIGFAQWLLLGFPTSLLLLAFCWYWITRKGFRPLSSTATDTKELFQTQLQGMGAMSSAERRVGGLFLLTASAWIFRPILSEWTGLAFSDAGIAICATIILFIIPANNSTRETLMTWESTRRLPWGVLLLFGGGLSLAAIIEQSGLAAYIAHSVSAHATLSLSVAIILVTITIVFLTEITSNTATAAGFLPLMGPIALSLGDSPLSLAVPVALAASCAFMMPVATPPNSVVFASGELEIRQMMQAGFILNMFSIALISSVSIGLLDWIF